MSAPTIDLVVERIVLEGVDLAPEQARTLTELVKEELRRLLADSAPASDRSLALTDIKPVALAQPPDLAMLGRALAQQIAANVQRAGAGHG